MKRTLLFFILLSSSLFSQKITIAVAANVSYAINELKKEFNLIHPDTTVQIILGGTGKLFAQIQHKAPYDILMAANMSYPEKLYQNGEAITRPLVYAQGSLAYLSNKKRDFSKGMELILNNDIKKIAIANPKLAPYGLASVEALKNSKLYEKIKYKFVYGDSISQTVTYTIKATDLGFIAKSALYSPQMLRFKKGIHWNEVNSQLYTPIDQGVVILKHGEKKSEVSAFYAFLFSKRAEKIFKKFGYSIP